MAVLYLPQVASADRSGSRVRAETRKEMDVRRIFRRMLPWARKPWYHTWDRAHLTTAERHELRKGKPR